MTRTGMGMTMELIMIAVVLAILAYVVIGGTSGGIGDFNLFASDNIHSSDINTCASKVEGFCSIDGNSGENWDSRYPECQNHAEAISGSDRIGEDGTCQGGS